MEFEADVIIAGAGSAGMAAALSAVGAGAECLVLESTPLLGGTITHSGIFSICGLFPPGKRSYDLPPAWNFLLRRGMVCMGKMDVVPVVPWCFGKELEELAATSSKLRVIRGMPVSEGMKFTTGALIDCTGGAELAVLAGVESVENPPVSPGLGFVLSGVDTSMLAPGAIDVTRLSLEEFPGVSLRLFPDLEFVENSVPLVPGMLNLPSNHVSFPEPELHTRATSLLDCMLKFLFANAPALKEASLFWKGERVGTRSGRVIRGRELLSLDGYHKSEDVSVNGFWPSELWKDPFGARFIDKGGIPIPDGCLEAEFDIPFFAAGKCISADPLAQASVRVAGTAIYTGARAGVLAARKALEGGRRRVIL